MAFNKSVIIPASLSFCFIIVTVVVASRFLPKAQDPCTESTTDRIFFWNRSESAQTVRLADDRTITFVSAEPNIKYHLADQALFKSKLQEFNFWGEQGLLSTESKPRRRVSPKNICIIITPEVQPYNQLVDSDTRQINQSSSTLYVQETDTLRVYVHFNLDFYSKNLSSKKLLGSVITYELMSILYKISRPSSINEKSLADRDRDKQAMLADFTFDDNENKPSMFRAEALKWAQ